MKAKNTCKLLKLVNNQETRRSLTFFLCVLCATFVSLVVKKNDYEICEACSYSCNFLFADILPWIPSSPHIPHAQSPLFYPATGIIGELYIASIGVGYTLLITILFSAGSSQVMA